MRNILIITIIFFLFSNLYASNNLKFFVTKALEKNYLLNAERKKLESAKQNKIISRSEFFPNLTISGNQTSTNSTKRTNQNGAALPDSNSDTETQKITLEQKIFSGFKGINTFRNQLETQRAKLELKKLNKKQF